MPNLFNFQSVRENKKKSLLTHQWNSRAQTQNFNWIKKNLKLHFQYRIKCAWNNNYFFPFPNFFQFTSTIFRFLTNPWNKIKTLMLIYLLLIQKIKFLTYLVTAFLFLQVVYFSSFFKQRRKNGILPIKIFNFTIEYLWRPLRRSPIKTTIDPCIIIPKLLFPLNQQR